MIRYSFIIILMAMTINAGAQAKLEGKITDERGEVLPGATVLLRHAADSLVAQALVSDSAGRFLFRQVKHGNYLLQASFVTYTSVYQQLLIKDNAPAPLLIMLKHGERQLQAVTIEGRKPAITMSAGKTTMNVENSALSQSRSAFDLLKSMPGVTVSKDGEIKTLGKPGVAIMIDGEPVEMSNTQLKQLLQSTPGAALASIEIMKAPPASMDASGGGGAINFVFKKKVQKGFNGSIASGVGAGRYVKTDHSITLSYGAGKWNLHATYALDVDKTWQRDSLWRPLEHAGPSASIQQLQLNPQRTVSHLAKLVADHYLGEKNTLGLTLSYNGLNNPYTGNTYTKFYSTLAPDSLLHQHNNIRSNFTYLESTLRFRRKIDERRTFSASLQASRQENKSIEHFNIQAISGAGAFMRPFLQYRNTYPGTVDRYSFRTDYTENIHLLGEKIGKVELGIKSSWARIHNRQESEHLFSGRWQPDHTRNNRFRYREAIQAAYAGVELNVQKLELRGGLRGEFTNVRGDSLSGALLVKQQYFSLFPNLQVAYNFHENYKLSLSYNRRIDRPEYDKLNPARRYLDIYTVETGNPYLKPQYSDNIEIGQQFFSFIDLSAGYSIIRNPLYESFLEDNKSPEAKYTTINAGRQHQWFGALSFPVPGIGRWENYQSVYMYSSSFNAVIAGQEYRERAVSFGASTYNSVKLPYGLTLELNGWYESGGLFGNFRYKPMAEVSIGVSKKFMQDRLNMGISVNDVFYSGMFRASMLNKGMAPSYLDSRTDSRVIKLMLNFRFGRKPAAPKEEQPAAEEGKEDRLRSGRNRQPVKAGRE